jgi:tetratricopeptide (TPR) repeat protein
VTQKADRNTYEEMDAFAAESESRSTNPRMHALGGYADMDRCNMAKRNPGEQNAALEACARALSFGETADALIEQARLLERSNPQAALRDANRALALRPQDTEALAVHARLSASRRDYAGHGRDLALLRELDPVRKVSKAALAWAAQGLAADAGRARREGRTDDQITALERAIALDPDNLDNHLRLDDALVQAGQLQRVPPIWRDYLRRHPRDARAHLELAGALHHLGREPEALAEADAACRLGERTGCAIAARFGGRR